MTRDFCLNIYSSVKPPSGHVNLLLSPHPLAFPLPFSLSSLAPLRRLFVCSLSRSPHLLLLVLLCLYFIASCSRIYEILPQRIQQWQQSPCIAEEHGKKLLERIRREQQSARTRLQEMERRFHELEAIILRAKQQAVREDEEVKSVQLGRTRDLVLPGLIIPLVPYRTTRMTATTQTCRFSASPVGIPSTHVLPCATWSVAMPRSGSGWYGDVRGPTRPIDLLSGWYLEKTPKSFYLCSFSSMKARHPLGPCTPHALKGE